MEITRGKQLTAQKVIIYGAEGIGKTTFASHFPEPLFIDTEGSTKHLDVSRLPNPSSFTMLIEQIKYVRDHSDLCKTLVIDTIDWAESLCIKEFCDKKQITGIEDIGYGKGYNYIMEEIGRMLNLLNEVIDKGINVVMTAHAQMRKFEQPDELGAYDRWELKLQKKNAPIVKEWADMVLFANYKTLVINVDNQGATKGKNKPQGGQRVMYTSHHPCWDAKNRHGLKDELPFDFGEIIHCFTTVAKEQVIKPIDEKNESVKVETKNYDNDDKNKADRLEYECLPKSLKDLMEINFVTVTDLKQAIAKKGYYPLETPLTNYDKSFIDGVLVGAWKQVLEVIDDIRLPY